MKELWIKKTIYRRYLVKDENIEQAEDWLKKFNSSDYIEDVMDENDEIEYDNETIFLPIDYEVNDVKEPSTEQTNESD